MSSNNKKNFKQATISSFFQSPKNKNVVNEKPSFSNVNLSQFKKVKENQHKRSSSNNGDNTVSDSNATENLDNLPPNKRRNIYKSYHNALQKFKFNTLNNKNNGDGMSMEVDTSSPTDINTDADVVITSTTLNKTLDSNKTTKLLKNISKYSSSITTSPPKITKKKDEKKNYTPLELQYIGLKEKYPNMILAIEVGYKYRFFAEDAMVYNIIYYYYNF